MTATIYSFHAAEDHTIRATANTCNLQEIAKRVAAAMTHGTNKTRRVYVHNGLGIVAAGLCRDGLWHDTQRENYMEFEPKARQERAEAGLPND
jgi:hypothetical protein